MPYPLEAHENLEVIPSSQFRAYRPFVMRAASAKAVGWACPHTITEEGRAAILERTAGINTRCAQKRLLEHIAFKEGGRPRIINKILRLNDGALFSQAASRVPRWRPDCELHGSVAA